MRNQKFISRFFSGFTIIKVTKSGNSIVIRIPPEIAKFSGIGYKSIIRIFPVAKNKIELEVAGK